uniref:Uncharacterized protein n=1 Tax=Brassica oleracea var. oleracea TaxID=109376 RepID=A0A0D3AUU0_BRAOL
MRQTMWEGSDLYDQLVKAIQEKCVIMIVEIITEELVDVFKHKVMLKKRGDAELIESNDAEEISLEGDRSVLHRQLDAYSQACDDQQTPGAKRHGQPVCFGFLVR